MAKITIENKVPGDQFTAAEFNLVKSIVNENADLLSVPYDDYSDFPEFGVKGRIYIDKNTGIPYYWSGVTYVAIGACALPVRVESSFILKFDQVYAMNLITQTTDIPFVLEEDGALNGGGGQVRIICDGIHEITVPDEMIPLDSSTTFEGARTIVFTWRLISGTYYYWQREEGNSASSLPSQVGNAGKVLGTNGSVPFWKDVEGGSGAKVYNIVDYGAVPNDPSIDNTVAIQDTLNAAAAAFGGTVLIPSGVWYVKGALKSGSRAQLEIPVSPITEHLFRIRVLGETPPTPAAEVVSALVRPMTGPIIRSTIAGVSEFDAVWGSQAPSSPTGPFNYTYIDFENIITMTDTSSPNILSAWNLRNNVAGSLHNCKATVTNDPTQSSAPLASYGLLMPHNDNKGILDIGTFNCDGYRRAIWMTEHTVAQHLVINACTTGIYTNGSGANHPMTIVHLTIEGCKDNVIQDGTGGDNLHILTYNTEHYTLDNTKWYAFENDVKVTTPNEGVAATYIGLARITRSGIGVTDEFVTNARNVVSISYLNGHDLYHGVQQIPSSSGPQWNLNKGRTAYLNMTDNVEMGLVAGTSKPGDRLMLSVKQPAGGGKYFIATFYSNDFLPINQAPNAVTVMQFVLMGSTWEMVTLQSSGGGSGISGLTPGVYPIATSATTLGNGSISGDSEVTKIKGNTAGAILELRNTNPSGYTGFQLQDEADVPAAFFGHNNGNKGEVRLNAFLSTGRILLLVNGYQAAVINSDGSVTFGATPTFADDAAAAASSLLPGTVYKITGSTTLHQKP